MLDILWSLTSYAQDSHMCAVLVSEENDDPIIIEPSKSGASMLSRGGVHAVYGVA